ncbi:MAG: TIGR04255 family protein [Calditrichaeota bacterium]|nr:TIGR04255 family protein [Calditrichota bacterium]
MNLPEVPRVIFNKTTLREVICQFRYPTILRIGASEPADFQEEIRERFPLYQLRQEPGLMEFPEPVRQVIAQNTPKVYNFIDENKTTQLTLTQEFIALNSNSYGRFESFMEYVDLALSALQKIYRPNYYIRIGLRYLDIINKNNLNIEDERWSDLLKECFAGELGGSLSENIKITDSNTLYHFEWGALRCQHGLREIDKESICYYIDNDFFKDTKINFDGIKPLLKVFNEYERRFLRNCISDKLYAAMEPVKP